MSIFEEHLRMFSLNERGNTYLSNCGSHVLFIKLNEEEYFQAALTPANYPSWEIGIISLTDEQLVSHINGKLVGWTVNKCNLDGVNIEDDEVVSIEELENEDELS